MKKHIITISGKPGSGKSTASKMLAERLGYTHFSTGDLFRQIGKERGIDVLETNQAAETDRSIDDLVDAKLVEIGEKEDNIVIDSRMAWHFLPFAFRVYLDLDLLTAAQRILMKPDPTRASVETIPETPELYAERLGKRLESEAKRYLSLYNANPYDPSNYDLVIDTAVNDPEQVVHLIREGYEKWLQ